MSHPIKYHQVFIVDFSFLAVICPSAHGLRRVLLAVGLCLLAACAPQPQVWHQEGYVFGTRVDLSIYDDGGHGRDAATAAFDDVLREFDRLHRAWHAWQPSELSRLNEALAAGRTAQVSGELAALLQEAQRLSALGDGLFDPGIGRLIALWGFQADEFTPRLPDADAVRALARAHSGIRQLHVEGNAVRSENAAVQLDLGGYAKGYALDRAAEILRRHGFHNALINIGGNLLALGSKGGTPWRIGIQHPREGAPLATLPLYDGEAVGTSGDYQRYFELDGRRYSHLIDPRSGAPAQGTQSLTVLVTPRPQAGVISDAASKAPFIAGARHWRDYTRRYGIDHALRVDADGSIQITRALRARTQLPARIQAQVQVVE